MKKKNVIGHMVPPKETAGSRFRRWHLLSRFLCLLLAVLIWLLVVNLGVDSEDPAGDVLPPAWEQPAQ